MLCPFCDLPHDDVDVCPVTGEPLSDDDITDQMDRATLDEIATHVGQTIDGKYEVVELLGQGAVGRVYRARQEVLARDVALKVLRQSFADTPKVVDRFLREARAVGVIEHPNVVQIYDAGVLEDGLPYLAMELVEGESLTARIARHGRLPLRDALHIGAQILAGLEQAHRAGVIHRDVKPDNVLVTPDDVAKIVDFGVARLETTESQLTQRGEVLGTPSYLSPEQAIGSKIDAKADAWATAVVLYEMSTGERPFRGSQFIEILTAVMASEPVPPSAHAPDLPPEFDALVLSGLAKDAEARADAATLSAGVHRLLARLGDALRDTGMAAPRLGSLAETLAEKPED
ncbi:MAG: serine/threonine-protein kinase [Sandaracinaceae bacterium]